MFRYNLVQMATRSSQLPASLGISGNLQMLIHNFWYVNFWMALKILKMLIEHQEMDTNWIKLVQVPSSAEHMVFSHNSTDPRTERVGCGRSKRANACRPPDAVRWLRTKE